MFDPITGAWRPDPPVDATQPSPTGTQQPPLSQWAQTQKNSYQAAGDAANVAAQGAASAPANPDNRNFFQKTTDAVGITNNDDPHNLPPPEDSNGKTASQKSGDDGPSKGQKAATSAIQTGANQAAATLANTVSKNENLMSSNTNMYDAIFGQSTVNAMTPIKKPTFGMVDTTMSDIRSKENVKQENITRKFLDALNGRK